MSTSIPFTMRADVSVAIKLVGNDSSSFDKTVIKIKCLTHLYLVQHLTAIDDEVNDKSFF